MRKRMYLSIPTALALLVSCVTVPAEIGNFLGNLTYVEAFNTINVASYELVFISYDGNEFVSETGRKLESFRLDRTDRDRQNLVWSIAYQGDQALVQDVGDYIGYALVNEETSYTYDEDTGKYDKVYKKTYEKDGSKETASSSEAVDKLTAVNTLSDYLFGEGDTNYYGLYYGSFLQSQSKGFSQFMSVDSTTNTLTYDPPATGQDIEREAFADIVLTVDSKGMLLTYQGKSYDVDDKYYSSVEKTCSYQ